MAAWTVTVAPAASSCAFSFSAAALDIGSLTTFGSASTKSTVMRQVEDCLKKVLELP